jgi:anti-anti-sigma factor
MVPVGSSYFTVPDRAPAPGTGAGEDPTVVWLTGEHDISTDGALSRVLARAIALGATALVVDLSEIGFMAASTLGTIVRAREYLRRRPGSLTVRSVPPFILRIIDICGLRPPWPQRRGSGQPDRECAWLLGGCARGRTAPWTARPVGNGAQSPPCTRPPRRRPKRLGYWRRAASAERMTRATVDNKA